MNENSFFKPTVLYKEFMILDLIEKNAQVTQREMSQAIGVATSMINSYLDDYEAAGLVKRKKYSTKKVEYFVTKKGSERRKVLNIGYLRSAQELYNQAKSNIETFLIQLNDKGFKNILLYGAGEVAEILIQSILTTKMNKVNVIAIIDDDPIKIGLKIGNLDIISIECLSAYAHDGILISTYNRRNDVYMKLREIKYPTNRIIQFFFDG